MGDYHFGVPGMAVWLSHIVFGLYFIYLGYLLTKLPENLYHGIVLIVLGVLMSTYHAHLWYYEKYVEYQS